MSAEKTERDERETQLDEVIASYLEAVEAGAAPDRDSWLRRYPHLAAELSAFFADEARFDGLVAPLKLTTPTPRCHLTPTNGEPPEPARSPPAAAPTAGRTVGDYELLEEAARGGMGVVYRARQVSLNRVVALKMIRDAEWATPADVQRFRLEAEAVAQLDHPNIVPVYEVGQWHPAGSSAPVHFFSMKWVEGGTLAQALASGRWSPGGRAAQRAAASLVAQVARAVHYAHQRGILHRDLKPANILLQSKPTTDGTDTTDKNRNRASLSVVSVPSVVDALPMITDFGLAKRVAADDRLTQTGVAVGTPSYMAPEQAAPAKGRGPRGDRLTLAADVYSLGAILYELLTGRPPFKGETMLDTLRDVLEREPARPRALNAALDRDLETVCLKCLQKDPGKRYASAAALAEDLERWLAGEPIQARPVSRAERLWRWCRRNPTLAATSLLAALAIPAALALLAVVAVNESRHAARLDEEALKLQNALLEVKIKNALAEKNLAEADRQRAKAVKNFEEAQRQRDREERSFRQAHEMVNVFKRLADELKTSPSLRPLRQKLYTAARDYYRRFLEQRKDDPRLKRELADAHFNAGNIGSEVGSRAEALADYRQALALYEELLAANPGDRGLRARTGGTCYNLGLMLTMTGRPKEALAALERSQGHYDQLLRERPGLLTALSGMADNYMAIGTLHRQQGKLAEAHEAVGRSVAIRERMARARPRDLRLQGALALAYNNLGVSLVNLGRRDEALQAYDKAAAIRKRLVEAEPKNWGAKMALAASYRDIGLVHRDRGAKDEALRWLEEARDIRARVAEANPGLNLAQTDLAASYVDVASILGGNPKTRPKALLAYRKAVDLLEGATRTDPATLSTRYALARTYFMVGSLRQTDGKHEAALEELAKARALLEKLIADAPERWDYHSTLANVLQNTGLALANLRRRAEARGLMGKAIEQQRRAAERAPQVSVYRRRLATHYNGLTELELAEGRPGAAAAAAQERAKLLPADAGVQYAVACDLARAAALVGKGKPEPSAAEQAERERYADQAMAALRRALGCGFRDRQRIQTDPALEPLRSREDFQRLSAELAAP